LEIKGLDVGMSMVEQAEQISAEFRARADKEAERAQSMREKALEREAKETQAAQERDRVNKATMDTQQMSKETQDMVVQAHRAMSSLVDRLDAMTEDMKRPREVERDGQGRPISVGGRPIRYNSDGSIKGIG
jgi:hypothetical protein